MIDNNFSIVIPTKNRIISLLKTLDSIKNQSILPIDLIIVDQSKTNLWPQIYQYYHNDNFLNIINYFYMPSITGLVEAKKYGLGKAQTNLICFLEDDLFLLEDFLFQLHNSFNLKKNINGVCGVIVNHPKYSVLKKLIFNIFHLGFLKDIRVNVFDINYIDKNNNSLIFTDKISCGISMWKKNVFNDVHFDTENKLHFTEDIDLSSRIVNNFGKCTYINTAALVRHDTVNLGRINSFEKIYHKVREYKIYYKKRKSLINLLNTCWLFIGFFLESLYLSILNFNFKPIRMFYNGLFS